MTHPLRLQSILQQPPQDISDMSIQLSFTLEDILNEKILTTEVLPTVHHDDLFFEDDFDDHTSSLNKQPKSVKNTVTDSGGKGKSAHEIATNNTSTDTPRPRKTKTLEDQQVQSLNYNTLDNLNAICLEKKIGLPSAITTLGNGCLIIGTTLANIIVFDIGQNEPTVIRSEKSGYGAITTISISKDQIFIACGCQSGFIFLADKSSSTICKIIPPQIFNVSICKLMFIGDDYSHLLKNDSQGNVHVYTVEKMMWQIGVLSRRLLPHRSGVIYHDVRSIVMNRKNIVCLSSQDFVLCLMFFDNSQPEVISRISRPKQQKYKDKTLNIELGSFNVGGQIKEGLFISWGNIIELYCYSPLERKNQFVLHKSVTFDAMIQFEIFGLYQLALDLIVIVDNRNCIKLANLAENPPQIYSDQTIPHGIISQKLLNKNNKPLKSFSNTISKATLNNKDIYFISGTQVVRARLLGWVEYIRYLIEKSEWDKLFVQSIQIFQRKINAFSDSVNLERKQVFQNIISKYVINKLLINKDSKTIIPQAIEYCLSVGIYSLLFNKLFAIFEKEGWAQIFMESLEPFIHDNLILQLPNNDLLQELMMIWSDTKPQLLQQLLVQLNKSSMNYLLTVQLCRKYGLYVGLLYISQINNDFITPLNRLIEVSQKDSRSENKEQLINLIYEFVRKTSCCITITGNKTLPQQLVKTGLPRLVLWLLLEQNMEWLIDFDSALYFREVQRLLEMGIVKYYIDLEFEEQDIIGHLFDNCQILLERIRSSQLSKNLANCLLAASKLWALNAQQSYYMLYHFNDPNNLANLMKYVDLHYEWLKQNTVKWNDTLQKIPQQIRAIIFIKQGQQLKGLDLYQNNKHKYNTSILFQRLNPEQVVTHLQQLTRIDCKLSAQYLYLQQTETIPKLVRRLSDNLSRYLLMRYLLKLDAINHIFWGMEDLMFYIASLCQFRGEKRVLYELKKAKRSFQFFQLYRERVIPIIKRYRFLSCEAFLSEPQSSFEIYKILYKETFQANFQKLLKFEQNDGQDLNTVFINLSQTLEKLSVNNNSDKIWFQFLQTILSPFKKQYKKTTVGEQIQKIYKMKGSEKNVFLNVLMHIIEQSLLVVSSHTTIDEMTRWMENNLKILELKFIINCFCSTLRIYSQHSQTIQLSTEVVSSDIVDNLKRAMQIKTKGISLEQNCSICSSPLYEQRSVAYPCGHGYHMLCCSQVYRDKCKVCIEEQLSSQIKDTKVKQQIQINEFKARQSSIQHKNSQDMSATHDKPSNMVYTFMAFDEVVQEGEQDFQKFKNIYEAYMIL